MSESAVAPRPAPQDSPREAEWLNKTYQPNATNLTIRAAVIGMVIGAAMSLSNLYVFFKTGWSMGVTLTACIL
ncbi:MAG TPA: OPT family oligopeptide transporter, partial [Acidobacteriota bacterium]|nr:OPT family oligopeptide transporter [Acidobacteriota bacterium]